MGLALAGCLLGGPLSARAAPSETVGVKLHILNPPDAITDLTASPVGSQDGDIQLIWTAPFNRNRIGMDFYRIRFATTPAPSQAQAENWWTAATSETVVNATVASGIQEFTVLGGFTLGTTYYFGIKAVDVDGMMSPIDDRVGRSSQAASLPLDTGLTHPPATPTNFAGVVLSTQSIQWTWDAIWNTDFYRLYEDPSQNLIAETTDTISTETGLLPNTRAARFVRAFNGYGFSDPTTTLTLYTLANRPINLAASTVSFNSVTLVWNANANTNGTRYRLERSLDGTNFMAVVTQTALSCQDTGLTPLTTYYYRVVAINGGDVESQPTAVLAVMTALRVDNTPPNQPGGLEGVLDPSGRAFTLLWETVDYNADGTPITDLAGYNIYRRDTLTGAPTRLNALPINVTAFADRVDGRTFYYTIRAIDSSGNESEDSLIADSSSEENVIFIGADNISSVFMPQEVNDLLRSNYNKYGVPLTITLREDPVAPNTDVLRTIRLQLRRLDTKDELNDLAFASPQAVISIGYNLVNGQLMTGAPNSVQEAPPAGALAVTPDQLCLYWHNGVTWVKIGGTLDLAAQAVKTRSSYLGSYQLRVGQKATSLSLEKGNVYPRVITPNGDGLNDRVNFVFENPNNASLTGEILDMEGRFVATLPPPSTTTGIGTTTSWDGRDMNGSVVPSGVYIYRIRGEGKTFNGTVAVAR